MIGDGQIEADFYREMGQLIEEKRKHRGIAMQGLAKEVGVHRNTMMRYESGEQSIPIWILLRVADVLCCNHLLLVPKHELVWGGLREAIRERDPGRGKTVQRERDPIISMEEENRLRMKVYS